MPRVPRVSNPSRGTCAFGQACQLAAAAPIFDVSNPSRGTCAFGLIAWAVDAEVLCPSQTPLGERVPSALVPDPEKPPLPSGVSNPSRGTCAFGLVFQTGSDNAHLRVSNPSRGTCAFGRKGG